MCDNQRNRGVMSVLAMMFLVIFSALGAAMAIVAQGNLQTAASYQHVNRSLAAAETGMQFARYRIGQIANTITISEGQINQALAEQLWIRLRDQIMTEMGDELHSLEPYHMEGRALVLGRVATESGQNPPTFRLVIEPHPLAGEDYNSAYYQRAPFNLGEGRNQFTVDGEAVSAANPVAGWWIRVTSIGDDNGYQRTVQMDFRIDKKVRFAILSRSRIMIGRNVIIEGAIGSKYTMTDEKYGHPVQMRDNFHNLNPTLDGWLDALRTYLADNDIDGDNRVRLADPRESISLNNAADYDRNLDGYVDNYDLFLLSYDGDSDGAISASEFSPNGSMEDPQLWQMINEAKYPAGTEFDWANLRVRQPGQEWVDASTDLNLIDNADNYAKIHGEVVIKASMEAWESGAANGRYQDYLSGPIHPNPDEAPLTFGADDSQLNQFQPTDFDVSQYRNLATGDFQTQASSPTPNDPNMPTYFTPPSSSTMESVPYNSPHPYDWYKRPVYENMVFENVTIPKGTNAVFRNCKFIGVTFVDTESNNSDPNYNYAGTLDDEGNIKYSSVTATVNGQEVTDTKTVSNNLRFDGCDFEGIVVTETPQEYSHVRNKLQFTGHTSFNLNAPSVTAEQRALFRKSTIMAPHHSIDVGTFTDPTSPTEVMRLEGTIVAGVLDIRGQARIDGSLITTFEPVPGEGPLAEGGSPASFNTTIGYFESTSGDSEAEMPMGGYGKIVIRYDPTRPMPDGILGPIEFRPDYETYFEGNG